MTMTTAELKAVLNKFTGSRFWYRHELFGHFTYTDGVLFLAENARADWLIDLIFLCQRTVPAVRAEPFQCWKLEVKDFEGKLTCEDGNYNQVYSRSIKFTDFPMEEVSLWFANNTLYLPSEH